MNKKEYFEALKSMYGLSASIGVLVPGISFFFNYDPPLLTGAGLITAGLGVATVMITYYYKPKQAPSSSSLPTFARIALKMFLLSIVLIVVYVLLLHWCTVVDPQKGQRFQIGFGIANWTLTEQGVMLKEKFPDMKTPLGLMMIKGAFEQGRPELIWRSWSIYVAGTFMIISYTCAFIIWVFAWSILAKQKASSR